MPRPRYQLASRRRTFSCSLDRVRDRPSFPAPQRLSTRFVSTGRRIGSRVFRSPHIAQRSERIPAPRETPGGVGTLGIQDRSDCGGSVRMGGKIFSASKRWSWKGAEETGRAFGNFAEDAAYFLICYLNSVRRESGAPDFTHPRRPADRYATHLARPAWQLRVPHRLRRALCEILTRIAGRTGNHAPYRGPSEVRWMDSCAVPRHTLLARIGANAECSGGRCSPVDRPRQTL